MKVKFPYRRYASLRHTQAGKTVQDPHDEFAAGEYLMDAHASISDHPVGYRSDPPHWFVWTRT